jgi:hypothetical protein
MHPLFCASDFRPLAPRAAFFSDRATDESSRPVRIEGRMDSVLVGQIDEGLLRDAHHRNPRAERPSETPAARS